MIRAAEALPPVAVSSGALVPAENALRADSKRQTVVRALALTPGGATALARHRDRWLAAGCARAPFDFVVDALEAA